MSNVIDIKQLQSKSWKYLLDLMKCVESIILFSLWNSSRGC